MVDGSVAATDPTTSFAVNENLVDNGGSAQRTRLE